MGSNPPQDRLTGLPTRAALDDLDRDFRKRPAGEPWSALVIDVDDFKMINDVFGHLAGDRILQQVAYLLVRNVRQSDEALRFGGDEFVVILRGTGKLQAANLASRFLEDVQREPFQGGVRVGVSLGLAECAADDRNLAAVMEKADRALYDSKARGKGKLAFFQDRSDREADLSFEHFVNRQAELKELRSALDDTLENRCGAVLVTGEPGVGKTRLVSELRHYCAFKRCAFAEVKYDEVGGAEPFGLVLEPIRALTATLPDDDREAVASACGPVLPETAGLFPSLGLKPREGPLPPEWARGRVLYSDVISVLRALTARLPVTLLVDDLQWAHLQDLDLLGYIARSAGSMRLLIVFTMRAPVEDYREAWSWLGVLRRFIPLVRIDLRPLEDEHAANMVMLALRDPQMPQGVLETITRQSGGNPYYIRELLKSLRQEGALPGGVDHDYRLGAEKLPDGIAQLVRSRLDLLDSSSREVLRMGALMPGSFSIDTVSFLLEIPALKAARALDEPLRMGLVHEEVTGSGEPVCRFNHDCVRSCLLEELSVSARRALYSRLGRHYEWRWGKGEEHLLAQVAYCYCESPETEKAAGFALLAAEEAKSRRASFDQAAWLERFVRFAGASPNSDAGKLFESLVALGDLCVLHGRHDDAQKAFDRAAGLASGSLQKGELAYSRTGLFINRAQYDKAMTEMEEVFASDITAEKKLICRIKSAFIWHFKGESGRAAEILDEVARGISSLPEGLEKRRIEAAHDYTGGVFTAMLSDPEKGIEMCRRGVDIYREIGDTREQVKAMINLASTLSMRNAWEERLALLGEAVALLTESGDVNSLMVAYVNLGQVYQALNQDDLAEDYYRRCLGLVEATGTPRFGMWAECQTAIIREARGEYEEALKLQERVLATARGTGDGRIALIAEMSMAEALAGLGRLEEARAILDRIEAGSVAEKMGAGMVRGFLQSRGRVLLRDHTGDRKSKLEQALDLFRKARSHVEGTDSLSRIEMAWNEARTLEELGRLDEMRIVVADAMIDVEKCLADIQSPLIREDLKKSSAFRGLRDLQGLPRLEKQAPGSVL